MNKVKKIAMIVPAIIAAVIGIFYLLGLLTQFLWNSTITEIFGTTPITFWQSIMLIVLAKILFSNEYTFSSKKRKKLNEDEE